MADRMTSIELKGRPSMHGRSEYGRKTRAEMIAVLRRAAEKSIEEAMLILEADDDDFLIETYTGKYARNNIREVLE